MTATLVALACPNCGGMLELTTRPDLFKCAHCRHLALLRWPAEAAPQVARFEEKQAWKANLLRPGSSLNWQGGDLRLSARELVFTPHAINFGPIEKGVVPLDAIRDIQLTKGLLSDELTIADGSGQQWGVRVFRGAEVENAIEKARAASA